MQVGRNEPRELRRLRGSRVRRPAYNLSWETRLQPIGVGSGDPPTTGVMQVGRNEPRELRRCQVVGSGDPPTTLVGSGDPTTTYGDPPTT